MIFFKKSIGWLLWMINQNQMRTSFSEGYGLSCLLKQTAKGRLEVCSCMKVSILLGKEAGTGLWGHKMPPHDRIVRKRMGRTQCCQLYEFQIWIKRNVLKKFHWLEKLHFLKKYSSFAYMKLATLMRAIKIDSVITKAHNFSAFFAQN